MGSMATKHIFLVGYVFAFESWETLWTPKEIHKHGTTDEIPLLGVAEQYLEKNCPISFHYTSTNRYRCQFERLNLTDPHLLSLSVPFDRRTPPQIQDMHRHFDSPLLDRRYWFYRTKSKQWWTTFGYSRQSTKKELKRAGLLLEKRSPKPNMYIFLFDSTSRELFHRQASPFLKALKREVSLSDASLIEFQRHSTVGWGTSPNTRILYRGCGAIPGGTHAYQCNSSHPTLSSYFGSDGYTLLGGAELYERNKQELFMGEIPHNIVSRGCKYGSSGTALMVDLFLKLKHESFTQNPETPQYFAMHESENHGGSGICGECLRPLIQQIDYTKSIVLFVADHGKRYGRFSSESSNPLALLSLPNSLVTPSIQLNRNKLTTHWDLHATLVAFTSSSPTKINQYCDTVRGGCLWRKTPPASPLLYPWGIDLRRTLISTFRSCDEAMAFGKFCYCTRAKVMSNSTLAAQFLAQTIQYVNMYTGNGSTPCRRLEQDDFNVERLERTNKIFNVIINSPKSRFLSYFNSEGVERVTNAYGQRNMPSIVRLDRFDRMPCLGSTGELVHPPLFMNDQFNEKIMINGSYSNHWNLRWCVC
jgi:hypothetical protein